VLVWKTSPAGDVRTFDNRVEMEGTNLVKYYYAGPMLVAKRTPAAAARAATRPPRRCVRARDRIAELQVLDALARRPRSSSCVGSLVRCRSP
jgi:hypothetical protein